MVADAKTCAVASAATTYRRPRRRGTRRATAVAELAICLPVIALVLFGSIQACSLMFLKHAAISAAYEGSLELAKSNASNTSVTTRVQQVLDARGVTGGTILIKPNGTNVAQATAGDTITIVVRLPTANNLTLDGFFPSPNNVESRLAATR